MWNKSTQVFSYLPVDHLLDIEQLNYDILVRICASQKSRDIVHYYFLDVDSVI